MRKTRARSRSEEHTSELQSPTTLFPYTTLFRSYGVITMEFIRKAGAPGGLELSSWATLDAQNTRTIVSLSNQQYGMAVADNTFRYNDPRGATHR